LLAFIAIELRSRAPLLPMRIFRLRTLAAANATAVLIAAVAFSQFFLLTLYLQDVLGYSALRTGAAFVAITLTILIFSNVAQTLVTRLGVRAVLSSGLLVTAAGLALLTRLPVHGSYVSDVLPALLVSGVGLAFSFVPVTIAGLTGVERGDAGVASGLINTSRQVGGAIGLAAISTVTATSTNGYASSHASSTAAAGAALTHGFQIAFVVLTGLAVAGAVIAGTLIEGRRRPLSAEVIEEAVPVEEAA
jgi:Na+/melibiose symporter-like transporter